MATRSRPVDPPSARWAGALVVVAAAAAAAGALLALAEEAEATHLRGGTLFWTPMNVTRDFLGQPTGWDVEITGTVNWRISSGWPAGTTVGTTRTNSAIAFGDTTTSSFCEEAIIVDQPRDWLVARIKAPDCVNNLRHAYATTAAAQYTASYSICCRISFGGASAPWFHINNPDQNQLLQTVVNLPAPSAGLAAANTSPRGFIPPIVDCPINNTCYIPIAAWDPDNDPLSFQWATSMEATGAAGFTQPGPPDAPNPATIMASPPQVVWNTSGAAVQSPCFSVYSAQLRVSDMGAAPGNQFGTTVPVDWFINLCPDEPPFWMDPPSPCVHLGHPYVPFVAGQMNSYTVTAAHNISSRQVSMFLSPLTTLPPGATQVFPPPGNPISSTLFWNPPVALTGQQFPVSYYAYTGSAYAPICEVIIRVVSRPPVADFVCATPARPYLRVGFQDRSSDPDSNIASWDWDLGDGSTTALQNFTHDYPAQGWYNVTLTVMDSTGMWASVTKPCYADDNLGPVLDPIGDKVVYEGDTLTFQISGRDPENDPTGFSWSRGDLPLNAAFSAGPGLFSWTPHRGSAGVYAPVHFRITELTPDARHDSEDITITVLPIPDPLPPPQADEDGDGVPDRHDVCPNVPNPDQAAEGCTAVAAGGAGGAGSATGADGATGSLADGGATGASGAGDGGVPGGDADALDTDHDGRVDGHDNCPRVRNADQRDNDRDRVGDLCDPDLDGDGVDQADPLGRVLDNCPYAFNPQQEAAACGGDRDGDGVGDADDTCVLVWNPDQAMGAGGACAPGGSALADLEDAFQQGLVAPAAEPDDAPDTAADVDAPWPSVGLVVAGVAAALLLRRRRA